MARVASELEDETLGQAPIVILVEPSTKESIDHVMTINLSPSWIDPIFKFLVEGKTLEDKNEAKRIKYQANIYMIMSGKLYKWGYAMPYLKCLRLDEAEYVIKEIHEGVCGNHSGKRSLAQKVLRQGYYWPTM